MFKALFKLIKKSIKLFAIFVVAILALGFAINTYHGFTDTPEEAAAREQAREQERVKREAESAQADVDVTPRVTSSDVPFLASNQQELARELCRNAFEIAGAHTTIDEWLFVEYKGVAENQHPNWKFRLPGQPWKDCAVTYKNDVMTVQSIMTGGINNNHKHIAFKHETGEVISKSF